MAKPPADPTREEKLARRKAAEEEALLREVDDAVRQGDMADFGRRYGKPLAGAIIALLVVFAGYLFWQSRQDAARERDGEVLVGALDQIEAGNLDSAGETLDPLVADGSDAARANALLLKAGIASSTGDTEEAARLFGQVAADDGAPPALRDLARIRQVAVRYDQMDKAAVIRELAPLARQGQPYFGSAGELVAMAYLQQGQRREAGALFSEIANDDSVPEGLRSRARQMAGVLGVDAIDNVEELLADQGVDTDQAPATDAE